MGAFYYCIMSVCLNKTTHSKRAREIWPKGMKEEVKTFIFSSFLNCHDMRMNGWMFEAIFTYVAYVRKECNLMWLFCCYYYVWASAVEEGTVEKA